MALSDVTRKRIEAEAKRRGIDPKAAIAESERRSGTGPQSQPSTPTNGEPASSKPLADRLLIGFLPFIKVHELRAGWLGLTDRIPDDELTCGEYQVKHGGLPGAAPAAE